MLRYVKKKISNKISVEIFLWKKSIATFNNKFENLYTKGTYPKEKVSQDEYFFQ